MSQSKSNVMMSLYVMVFMFCFTTINGHLLTNHSNVETLEDICPWLDNCKFPHSTGNTESASTMERNCACDHLCSDYGDCCIDAPGDTKNGNENGFKCLKIPKYGGVYMKDSCPSSYKGPQNIKQLCEKTKLGNRRDPVVSLPMTDSLTGVTYKNYYCSLCNGKYENMVLWTPKLDCTLLTFFNASGNLTEEYIMENLATDGQNWGVYLDGENGSSLLHECDIDVYMPSVVKNKIRLCSPDLISDCPLAWKDDEIRKMCRSYMGAKFARGGRGYKNIHCAICNQENLSDLSCQSGELEIINIFRLLGHSFSILMDFGEKTGPNVGMVQMCDLGDVYDPFFDTCRTVICFRYGYLRRGRECLSPYPVFTTQVSEAKVNRRASKTPRLRINFSEWKKSYQASTKSTRSDEQYTTLQSVTLSAV